MRTNVKKVLAVLLTMVMLCGLLPMGMLSVSAAETVVYNANFEDGALGGWWSNASGSLSVVSTSELPVANSACGSYVLKKVQPTGDYSFNEDQRGFTVKANTDYIVTLDVLSTSNNWPIQAFVSSSTWITAQVGATEQVNCKSTEWTTMTFEFNSGSNTKLYPSVKSVWENTTLYIDNFKIVEKAAEPEPEVPAGSANLVTNGDFENGNSGWRLAATASIVSGGYTGNAVQLNNPSAWSEAGYQEVAVEANESYTLTWRSKRVSGTGVFNMEIAKAPYDGMKPQVSGQTWMNDTSGTWIEHKLKIVMTDKDGTGTGISKIMIKLTTEASNPGVILIDDICLTKDLVASFDGYIYNGDFEIGNIDHWTAYNGTAASTAAAHSGYYGAHLKSNGSWGGVMHQSTVNVVAGKTYIISFYIKVIKNQMNLQIKDGTSTNGSVLSSKGYSSNQWTLVTFEVVPSQNGLVINFNGSGGESADPNNIGEAYVDDIKIELKGGNPNEKINYDGSSVRDEDASAQGTGKGLAFQFKVDAVHGVKNYDNTYEENSGAIVLADMEYTLVRMGAVMTNNASVGQNTTNFTLNAVDGRKVIDIPAIYLNGADAETLSYAVRILDIPDNHIGTSIYARPYYVYLENGQEVTVYGDTRSNNYAKAANISTADKSSIKILSIGHSFSKDVMVTNLWNMFKEGGYEEVTIGYLYMAGCSMPKHLYNINNNLAQYEYAKNTNGTWVTKNNTSALTALKEEDWDFVTVQSSPDYIGGQTITNFSLGVNNDGTKIENVNQTEYEAMGKITDWILANATNADVKIDYHMIWSFSQGCDLWSGMYHKDPATNKYSQMVMYQNIVNITQQQVQNHEDINRIIPSATAIQNARSSFMGDTFNMPDATQGGSDGYHLNDYGDYVAALTWYCHYSGDNANIMAGYTGVLSTDEFLAVAEAVNNAIDVPFAVIESTHK